MSEFEKWWKEEEEQTNQVSSSFYILERLNLTSSASFLLSHTQSISSSALSFLPKRIRKSFEEDAFVDIQENVAITTATTTAATNAIADELTTTTTATETTILSLTQLPSPQVSLTSTLGASNTFSRILNSAITIINDTTINEDDSTETFLYKNDDDNTYNDSRNWISSGSLLILIIIYGLVVLGGILGNASLVVTLCSQSSVRLRNPLLVALCLADLLVAGVSAPSTIVTLALTQKSWTMPSIGCKAIYYFQSMPVAASTISFLMLSLDRYAAVKHPNLAQLRQRRYVHTMLATFSWIGACAICIPILLAYKITNATMSSTIPIASTVNPTISPITDTIATTSEIIGRTIGKGVATVAAAAASAGTATSSTTAQQSSSNHQIMYTTCLPDYGSNELRTSFIIVHTVLVFIFPGLGVILNHYGVRRKLCALSLTARAAHGELPLPMPILRRPTHMIIVTGIANAARGVVNDDSSDEQKNNEEGEGNNDENGGGGGANENGTGHNGGASTRISGRIGGCGIGKNHNHVVETIIKTSPKSPRVMREIRIQQQRQKLHHHHQGKATPAPELPLPQTSTLRARRKLANMLVAAAFIFIGCWTPHVFCVLWTEFNNQKQYCSKTISYFSLLLGYTHSAISPIMYWTLNHNTLRQSPCAPFIRFSAIQRFLRNHLRSPAAPPPPSSTNEAALGAFNPRYIKTTPKQYRAQASSHYLY